MAKSTSTASVTKKLAALAKTVQVVKSKPHQSIRPAELSMTKPEKNSMSDDRNLDELRRLIAGIQSGKAAGPPRRIDRSQTSSKPLAVQVKTRGPLT
jgi:hypothetical protein